MTHPAPIDFDAPYRIACCLYESVAHALLDAGLRVPERGGITHKLDGDWECEDCESLWVWWSDSEGEDSEFGPKCFVRQTRTFQVMLAWNVCTERLDPCTKNPDATYDRCLPPVEGEEPTGCPDPPVPMIGEGGKCKDNSGLTVAAETAWIWRARYAIEKQVPKYLACCLRDCGGVPLGCKTIGFNVVSSEISGGCAFTTFEVQLKW